MTMIEYFDDSHMYLVDGVIVPSVTQIVRKILGEQYSGIPQSVLKKKADYGTKMHKWIEKYSKTGKVTRQSEVMKMSTDQYIAIMQMERLIIHSCEQHVAYKNRYAGTYDMYGDWKGISTLFDIKTTSCLNTDYLEWQLGMYKLAFDKPVDKCAVIWLPKKDIAQLIEINPKSEDEIVSKLDELFPKQYIEDIWF